MRASCTLLFVLVLWFRTLVKCMVSQVTISLRGWRTRAAHQMRVPCHACHARAPNLFAGSWVVPSSASIDTDIDPECSRHCLVFSIVHSRCPDWSFLGDAHAFVAVASVMRVTICYLQVRRER